MLTPNLQQTADLVAAWQTMLNQATSFPPLCLSLHLYDCIAYCSHGLRPQGGQDPSLAVAHPAAIRPHPQDSRPLTHRLAALTPKPLPARALSPLVGPIPAAAWTPPLPSRGPLVNPSGPRHPALGDLSDHLDIILYSTEWLKACWPLQQGSRVAVPPSRRHDTIRDPWHGSPAATLFIAPQAHTCASAMLESPCITCPPFLHHRCPPVNGL